MPLISYKNPFVKSSKEILLDEDFAKEVDKLVEIGKKYGIVLSINSGFRANSEHIQGAIVTPAKKSNHFTGCAIDANVYVNGVFFTSVMVAKPQGALLQFIGEWIALGNRWGGSFSTPDPIHFDSALYQKSADLWENKYREYHT